jgi:putative addiction module component (TIGR02574 family)
MLSDQSQALLDQILTLPEQERSEIARELFNSLSNEVQQELDDELKSELDRRWEEMESGQVKTIPWSEAKLRLRNSKGS